MLVSSDLQALVRAEHVAKPHGLGVDAARPDHAPPLDPPPVLVILDLDQLGEGGGVGAWMSSYGRAAPRVVGFFSHVQKEAGDAAAAAGVEVHRRGRFWKELDDLLAALV